MSCSHDLDAEYLYPSDAEIVDIYEEDDSLRVRILIPCPECDQPLELNTRVETVEESTLEFPIDDSVDIYD